MNSFYSGRWGGGKGGGWGVCGCGLVAEIQKRGIHFFFMAGVIPVFVTTATEGPNKPIPVYVVNSSGGGSDAYTKSESDAKYTFKDNFYAYAGGDELHQPASASSTFLTQSTAASTYVPKTAFYNYAGGSDASPPAPASSTYLTPGQAGATFATISDVQTVVNDIDQELLLKEDDSNKVGTLDEIADHYPNCPAVNTALSGYVSKTVGGTQTINSDLTVNTLYANGTIRLIQKTAGGDCIQVFPVSTAGYWMLSIRNSGGTKIGGLYCSANTVTIQADQFQQGGSAAVTTFEYTVTNNGAALPRSSAVFNALAGKIDTSAITTTINSSSTNAQVPGALAMKTYVDNVSTAAFRGYESPGKFIYANDTNGVYTNNIHTATEVGQIVDLMFVIVDIGQKFGAHVQWDGFIVSYDGAYVSHFRRKFYICKAAGTNGNDVTSDPATNVYYFDERYGTQRIVVEYETTVRVIFHLQALGGTSTSGHCFNQITIMKYAF